VLPLVMRKQPVYFYNGRQPAIEGLLIGGSG
jgi:hypothetical protein